MFVQLVNSQLHPTSEPTKKKKQVYLKKTCLGFETASCLPNSNFLALFQLLITGLGAPQAFSL